MLCSNNFFAFYIDQNKGKIYHIAVINPRINLVVITPWIYMHEDV